MGSYPTWTWLAQDRPMGRSYASEWYDTRPRAVKAAIVNNGPLTVEVLAADIMSVRVSTTAANQGVVALSRFTGKVSLPDTRENEGVPSDTAAMLSSVECWSNCAVSGVTEIVRSVRAIPGRYAKIIGTTYFPPVLTTAAVLVGRSMTAAGAMAGMGGGSDMPSGIVINPGEGVAVTAGDFPISTRAGTGGMCVTFVVRNVADGAVTTWVCPNCTVSEASAANATPRVFAALWNPIGSSEAVEVVSVFAECEHDESSVLSPFPEVVHPGVMPWTSTEAGHPTLIDVTSSAVPHDGVSDLAALGIQCVVGDFPLRLSRSDFARTQSGLISSGDESAVVDASNLSPLPNMWPPKTVAWQGNQTTVVPTSPGADALQPMFRTPKHRDQLQPVCVRPGEAFVMTLAAAQANAAITVSQLGSTHISDIDFTFQVRAPRGAPFARSA